MLRTFVPAALLIALLVSVIGCSTSQVGVKNTFGTYKTMLNASPDKVTEAAEEVAREMNLQVESAQSTQIDGKIEALTATDKKVTITAKVAGDSVSQIAIRVGAGFGDEALSLEILNRIKEKL